MQKNPWKIWAWVIELAFLFLALTAPLNPILTTKQGIVIWCFIMIVFGAIGVFITAFKAYPPEEISVK